MQEYGLLPENLTIKNRISSFSSSRGFECKKVVGEYFGDPKDFQVEVLKEYADLFNLKT